MLLIALSLTVMTSAGAGLVPVSPPEWTPSGLVGDGDRTRAQFFAMFQ
jgi:hypothetical protein